jgi:aminoglycoside/choline kinase family phosphotransferase
MVGRLALGGRLVGAAGRILADRIDEARGVALPRTPEQLARPEALNALFRAGTPPDAPALPVVRAARLPGVEFESSNCRNFLVELEFADAARGAAPLPRNVYAKIPCRQLATRAFAHVAGFWRSEVAFCRRIATRVPIRVPRVFAAVERGARFVLLLENVRELPGAQLFTNRDMAAGTTPERARRCVEAFAPLHAAFWNAPDDERERLLPLRLHPYLAPAGRERNRALNAASIAPAHRAAPDLLTPAHVALCREALAKWDGLLEHWYGGALTLIHGDSHLANCFEYDASEGRRVGMLDFQGVQWCHGMRDVQYFLIGSLDPSLLASCEDEMIRAYVGALAKAGVALDLEEARAAYRAFAFQTLMVAVVSLGLGSLTEREETVRTLLARCVAAIDRLGVGDWIAEL